VFQRWLGFLLIRRAYRLFLSDDPRPLRERLAREGMRILVAALVVLLVFAAAFLAALYYLIRALT
jgi:peptidoglycan/LPS O-acetylase OafA/YrhL